MKHRIFLSASLAVAVLAAAGALAQNRDDLVLARVNNEEITRRQLVARLIEYRGEESVEKMINRAILNGWFAIGFGGSAVLAAIAAVLHLGDPSLPWIIAALVLYVSTLVTTFGINVPLNNALDASGDPARSPDATAVRTAFEARWVRWNIVRTLVCVLALGCLAWALLVRGAP